MTRQDTGSSDEHRRLEEGERAQRARNVPGTRRLPSPSAAIPNGLGRALRSSQDERATGQPHDGAPFFAGFEAPDIRVPIAAASIAADAHGFVPTHAKARGAFMAAINHLENLAPIEVRESAMVGAYLAVIFALPDRAMVHAALGDRVLSRIDTHFLHLLDVLRGDASPSDPKTRTRHTKLASVLSAYLFLKVCPSDACCVSGTLDTQAWQVFINTFWRPLYVTAPHVYVDAARSVKRTDAHASFVRNVSLWAAEPGYADENRTEAALLIQMCSEDGQTALDLSYLGLRSLPGALWLIDQPGSACAAAGGLRSLRLNDNCLKQLPEAIGQLRHLRKLSISRNHLLSLPSTLGELTSLTSLQLSDNEISALPSSIGDLTSLQSLLADGCLLTSLPDELVSLPHLGEIDLDDNLLTSLPIGLASLPDTCIVRLFDNPLSSRVKSALGQMPQGPVCLVSDAGERFDNEQPLPRDVHGHRMLTDAVFDWLELPAHRTGAARKRWRTVEAMPHAASLSVVLDCFGRLADATNWNTRMVFRQRVAVLLLAIVERPALGRVCLGLARDALERGDTARGCLSRLEALVADDYAQHAQLPLSEILSLALRRFRLDVIDRIVRHRLLQRPFADESDLRLAYWHALATHADLGLQFVDADHPRGPTDAAQSGMDVVQNELDADPMMRDGVSDPAQYLRFNMLSAIPLCNTSPISLSAKEIEAALEELAAAAHSDAVVQFLIDYAPWRAGLCRQEHVHFEALFTQFDLEEDALFIDDKAAAATMHARGATFPMADAALIEKKRQMKAAQDARFATQLMMLTASWLRM